jgi:hypothetical protein
METIIDRLEAIHRALRNAPTQDWRDARVADSVALCLRDLHAIVAQERADGRPQRPVLRLIDGGGVPRPAVFHAGSGSLTQAGREMLRRHLERGESAP